MIKWSFQVPKCGSYTATPLSMRLDLCDIPESKLAGRLTPTLTHASTVQRAELENVPRTRAAPCKNCKKNTTVLGSRQTEVETNRIFFTTSSFIAWWLCLFNHYFLVFPRHLRSSNSNASLQISSLPLQFRTCSIGEHTQSFACGTLPQQGEPLGRLQILRFIDFQQQKQLAVNVFFVLNSLGLKNRSAVVAGGAFSKVVTVYGPLFYCYFN